MYNISEGDIIDGHIIVHANIGRGGMSSVHEALDPRGRSCALKILDRTMITSKLDERLKKEGVPETLRRQRAEGLYEKAVRLFKDEYQILAGLSGHPNVARAYSLGFWRDHFYSTQEFVRGVQIAEYLRGREPREMLGLFVQILEGLDFIHKSGLVHLDIKSENILVTTTSGVGCKAQGVGSNQNLTPDAQSPTPATSGVGCKVQGVGSNLRPYTLDPRPEVITPVVKIIDFGIATAVGGYGGDFFGSVPYMAPEIAFGWRERVDSRADLFSFGVLMYHCITRGRFPFSRTSQKAREAVRSMIEKEEPPSPPTLAFFLGDEYLTPVLDKIVFSLLKKNPEDRLYGNARAVINAMTTKMPEVFAGAADTRAAYLIPEGNVHIGRGEEQERIYSSVKALLSGESSFYIIRGKAGMGKTHFMQKVKEKAEKHVDEVVISGIDFPANTATTQSWNRELIRNLDENAKPVIVFADDAQLADGSALNILQGLALRISERNKNPSLYRDIRPVMLCVAMQEGSHSGAEIVSNDSARIIQLFPFGKHDVRAYLESTPAFKNKEISGAWVDVLYKRTDGIPRELAEHLETQDGEGLLFGPDGAIVMAGPDKRHDKLPESTRERLIGIYQKLPAPERALLDFLSVWYLKGVTRPISMEDLEEFFYSGFLPQSIKNLGAEAILTNENEFIKWRSDYFQRLVYELIPSSDKELAHDSIANYLKSDKDAVAFHLAFGGNHALAAKNAVIIGRKMLFLSGSSSIACELFKHAIEITKGEHLKLRAHLMGLLADALYYDGKLDESLKAARNGFDLVSKMPNAKVAVKLFFLTRIAIASLQRRNYEDAESAVSLGLKLANGGYPVPRLILKNCWAAILCQRAFENQKESGNLLAEAYAISMKSLEEESRLPKDIRRRVTNNQMGLVLRSQGKLKDAAIVMEEVLKEKQHSVFSSIAANIALAEVYRLLRDFGQAKEHANTALALSRDIGRGEWMMHAHGILANLYYDDNRFEEAMEENRRYMAMSACVSDAKSRRYISIRYCLRMGHCLRDTAKWDEAMMYFGAVIDTGTVSQDIMSAEEGMGEIMLKKGDSASALEHFLRAETVLHTMPIDPVSNSHRDRIANLKNEILAKQNDIK